MSTVKIHFKLQGLELDFEGTREDIPAISQTVGNQIAGIIEPAMRAIDGDTTQGSSGASETVTLEARDTGARKRTRRRKTSSSSSGGGEASAVALTWQHNPADYGTPSQSWNTATKAIWLLYVVEKVLQKKGLTAKQIEESFNKNFRQAGPIKSFNVTRDLGKAKGKGKVSPVSEDTTKDPSEWHLTEAGIQQAQGLIAGTEAA